MQRGASDFLTKPVDEKVLVAAVRSALSRYEGEAAARAALADAEPGSPPSPPGARRAGRVVGGALNKQIAARLGITEATVKVHRATSCRSWSRLCRGPGPPLREGGRPAAASRAPSTTKV